MENKNYFIYVIRCSDNSLYTGITTDVKRRFNEHVKDEKLGAKYTRFHKPVSVEIVWECKSRGDALRLEYAFKHLKKSIKEKIVSNPEYIKITFSDKLNLNLYKCNLEYKNIVFNEKNDTAF